MTRIRVSENLGAGREKLLLNLTAPQMVRSNFYAVSKEPGNTDSG